MYEVSNKHFQKFSRKSEANASEFPEDLEEMCLRQWYTKLQYTINNIEGKFNDRNKTISK